MGKLIIIFGILSFAACMFASVMYYIRGLRIDDDSSYGAGAPEGDARSFSRQDGAGL